MKNLSIKLFFIIPLLSIAFSKDATSLDEAIILSKEQNKPILIDIFADW